MDKRVTIQPTTAVPTSALPADGVRTLSGMLGAKPCVDCGERRDAHRASQDGSLICPRSGAAWLDRSAKDLTGGIRR